MTDDELASVRIVVGDATPPLDYEIEEIFDRVGSVGATIHEVTSKRLADLLASPATFAVPGEYSQSNEANIRAYQKLLEEYASFAPATAYAEVTIYTPVRRRPR